MTTRRRWLHAFTAAGAGEVLPPDASALAPGEPSRTAWGAALQRAAHQLLDRPLVFGDPLALRMLGAKSVRQMALDLDRFQAPAARALRAFLVARSRYAEDELERVFRLGTRQYVVLGAGLDTFAYRNPRGGRLRVFEVDHPATQACKRARLREQGIGLPPSLAFVPVDFERDSLADRLRRAGFRRDAPAFISWLGVTMYLTRAAVVQTLQFVAAACARGTEIVFDFSVPDAALAAGERTARTRLAQYVAGIGEPWLSHFDPDEFARELGALGFAQADHFGSDEANRRYFAGRTDGLHVRGSARMMTARV
jgi:methyltransferase (TIGR00027 family)